MNLDSTPTSAKNSQIFESLAHCFSTRISWHPDVSNRVFSDIKISYFIDNNLIFFFDYISKIFFLKTNPLQILQYAVFYDRLPAMEYFHRKCA